MLYVFCTYSGSNGTDSKGNRLWKNKHVHISPYSVNDPMSETQDCITETVSGDDIGHEQMVYNVLRLGVGSNVTLEK